MEIKLNLASKPYLNRQSVRLWLLIASSLLVILLLLNLIYGYQGIKQLHVLDTRFAELDKQVAGVAGVPAGYTPERYASLKKEVALANEIIAVDQFRWTEFFSRLEEVVPKDVSLRSIQPNHQDRSVTIVGQAKNVTAMTGFMDNLLTSDDLNQAFLQRHGNADVDVDGRKMQLTFFSLTIKEAF